MTRFEKLQEMCRHYLKRLKGVAKKHELSYFVKGLIDANKKGECEASVEDVEMLARIANDDRIKRTDVAKILGVPYRNCTYDDLFENVDRIENRSSYSRVSAELYACDLKNEKENG